MTAPAGKSTQMVHFDGTTTRTTSYAYKENPGRVKLRNQDRVVGVFPHLASAIL